jgi:hypothetical protein
MLDALPDDTWHDFVRDIRGTLVEHGYEFLSPDRAARLLDFDVEIPTILNDGPLRFFDAAFFWED